MQNPTVIGFAVNLAGPDIIILLIGGFIFWALMDCLVRQTVLGVKIVWAAVIICVPRLGAVAYFLFGRHAAPRRD